jgi:hypothetical protein
MLGGNLFLCFLAPIALLGLLLGVQLRLELAQRCAQALAQSWRAPDGRLEGSAWRLAGLAAANILIPLLASLFGLAALASHLGVTALASRSLHGLNVVQGALGLGLMAHVLRRRKAGHNLR